MNLFQRQLKCPFFYMASAGDFRENVSKSLLYISLSLHFKTINMDSFCKWLWNYDRKQSYFLQPQGVMSPAVCVFK